MYYKFSKDYQKLFWLVPCLLAFCSFINTVGFDFVYDDLFVIIKAAPALEDWSLANLKRVFTTDVWTFLTYHLSKEEQNDSVYYRPFFNLFLMVNYFYAGLSPWKWHLTSVMLHVFSTALVYQVVLASLRQTTAFKAQNQIIWLAFISASLFAIHPVQSESVAWVSAYVNAMLAIMIFIALLAYLKARANQNNKKLFIVWLLISVAFYSLAIFTKEVAMLLALILFCYEILLFDKELAWPKRLTKDVLMGIPFLLVTIGYFILRIKIIGAVNPGVISPDFPEVTVISRSVHIFTLPTIILTYIKNLIFPFSLSPLYPITYISSPGLENFYLPSLILMSLISGVIILSWRSLVSRIGFIWLLAPLLPVLDIRAFKPEDLMHDRYLYFSLIGAGILLGQLTKWLNGFLTKNRQVDKEIDKEENVSLRPSLLIIIGVYFIVLMVTTIKQNYVWADEWQLWIASREGFPQSCMANKELGRLSAISKMDKQAIDYYEQAKRTCPNSADVHLQLGGLYGRTGNLSQAEIEFKQMIALSPYPFLQAEGYFNLGLVYQIRGNRAQAILYYQKSLELNPKSKKPAEALQKLTLP